MDNELKKGPFLYLIVMLVILVTACGETKSVGVNINSSIKAYKETEDAIWSLDFKSPAYRVIENNNELICITREPKAYFIETETGVVNKVIALDTKLDDLNAAMLYENKLIVLNDDGRLWAVNCDTGEVEYNQKLSGVRYAKLDGDRILCSKLGADVFMLSADDFSEIWSYNEPITKGSVYSSLDDKYVYMNNRMGELVILDKVNGELVSKVKTRVRAPFLFEGEYAYARAYDDEAVKYDLEKHSVVWSMYLKKGSLFNINNSVIIYDISNNRISKVNKETGKQSILLNNYDDFLEDVKEVEDYLIFRNKSGLIQLLNKNTAKVEWEFKGEETKRVMGKIFMVGDDFIIPEGGGRIHRFSFEKIKEKIN